MTNDGSPAGPTCAISSLLTNLKPEQSWMNCKPRKNPSRCSRRWPRNIPIAPVAAKEETLENSLRDKWHKVLRMQYGFLSWRKSLMALSKLNSDTISFGCTASCTPSKVVGVPRFELGSKRPKRPSIGQTNPYALGLCHGVSPMNFTQRTSSDFGPLEAQDPRFQHVPSTLLPQHQALFWQSKSQEPPSR